MADDTPPDRTADRERPAMKIGDASYGRPPTTSARRLALRVERWFFLTASRWLVTVLLLAGVFATIVIVGTHGPVPVGAFLDAGIRPGAVLVELLKSIVAVLVIVLSINQLVLSPGLGPVGEQRERFEDTMDLRRRTESLVGVTVSPSSPARFLAVVTDAIADTARDLRAAAGDVEDTDRREELIAYAGTVASDASYVSDQLERDRFGLFEVTPTALRFAISEKIEALRGFERDEGHVPDASADRLADLLELFTVAREYLKTVYIRSEYIDLSTNLLYVGLPAIVLTYCAAQLYSPGAFPGATLGIENRLLFLSLAVTVALSPLALLVAYVFRLAAMSRSTLFVGPFAAGADD